jgi:hypothetical protein
MVTNEMRARFRAALAMKPYPKLRDFAAELRAEGVDQITMYRLFVEFQLATENDDRLFDAILDILDLIWGGPWAKGGALFDRELTSDDVK